MVFALVHLCEVGDTWCCAMVHLKNWMRLVGLLFLNFIVGKLKN